MQTNVLERPTNTTGVEIQVAIVLWPSFPLLSLTGIIESLRHAADIADRSRQIYCRWSVIGKKGSACRASCGTNIEADADYPAPEQFDYLFVVGGLLEQLNQAPQQHWEYIKQAADANVMIVGVCTGVFVLAQMGLLQGHTACIHPYHRKDFIERFPRLPLTTQEDYLLKNQRATVPGGTSIFNFMHVLITMHCGTERAAKVTHQITLTTRSRLDHLNSSGAALSLRIQDTRIQRALIFIESHHRNKQLLDDLANMLELSERQLRRLFKLHVGIGIKQYILNKRLANAYWLLQYTQQHLTAIALEVGFANSAHFSVAFKTRYGIKPSELRKSARLC